jgi:hypothetical protein
MSAPAPHVGPLAQEMRKRWTPAEWRAVVAFCGDTMTVDEFVAETVNGPASKVRQIFAGFGFEFSELSPEIIASVLAQDRMMSAKG